MKKIVMDANAALYVFNSPGHAILSILEDTDIVYAPELFKAEVGNSILQYIKHDYFDESFGASLIKRCFDLITDFVLIGNDASEILAIAKENSLSYYDAVYMHISMITESPLLTFDKKLYKVAKSMNLNYEV